MKHIKTLITITAATLLIISIFTAAAAADNVTTTDNSSTERVHVRSQFCQDCIDWYNYYKSLQEPNFAETLRTKIYNILKDPSLSWDEKQALIKPLMGWDYRLDIYFDKTNRTVSLNEDRTLSYNLSADHWSAILFGAGIDELLLPQTDAEWATLYQYHLEDFDEYVYSLLPQSQAEVFALHRIYLENDDGAYDDACHDYQEYLNTLRDAGNP